MTKLAILQMADSNPVLSTELMLRTAGYEVYLPNSVLRNTLRGLGLDTVLTPADLVKNDGYDQLHLPEIGPEGMDHCDLYCDVKAHRCYEKIVKRWPRLVGRVLYTRINGGKPEHVIKKDTEGRVVEDCGDEANPPCPILTPNLWYGDDEACPVCEFTARRRDPICKTCNGWQEPWHGGRAYACWPPYVGYNSHPPRNGSGKYHDPACFVHNVSGWGYKALCEPLRAIGVRIFGNGSPDGLVRNSTVNVLLRDILCMVHLKSNDAPGYALLQALAAGCPVVCTRRLIWRCRMQDLLIPNETCLVFDQETHKGLSDEDVVECVNEVKGHLKRLCDPTENRRIGEAGRAKLKEVMWSPDRKEDVESLNKFFSHNFRS